MPWNNDATTLIIIDAISGFSGLFVYSPTPGTGNLVASITASAGTDPYGNPYEAGITLYDSNGNPRLVEVFSANPNFEMLNAAGSQIMNLSTLKDAMLWYLDEGVSGQGPLFASIAPLNGSDIFGNTYEAGVTSYSQVVALLISQLLGGQVNLGIIGSPSLGQIGIYTGIPALLGQMTGVQIRSGQQVNTDVQANVAIVNTTGGAGSPAVIVSQGAISGANSTRIFQVGGSGTINTLFAWEPGSGNATEEVWNSLGTLAGATVNKGRYRLLPDGEVKVEIDVAFGVATAVPITFSNTIPAGWRPPGSVDVRSPSMGQTNAAGALARIFVGSAGGGSPGQVQLAALANVIGTYSMYFSYSLL